MSLCSDGSTDESESSEEEELITWRYQKSTKHGANVCFRPEVVVEQPNKQRKQIGVQNNLTFKFVRSSTSLIRNILTAYGFKEARETSNDYNIMWLNSHVKPYSLRNLMDFQRVNHFPRSYELTRKNLLARNVERMAQTKNAKLFDFCPKSYMMPGQYQDFCHAAAREKGPWIVKPQASSRGRGIFLVNSPSQVPLDDSTMVCRYIHNPLLIDGFKFDVRLYVAVTCYDPLIIYLYEEGMARFATIKYETSLKSIKNQWMHLTNYSINKKNPEFVRCDDAEQEDFGNKWTLGALLSVVRNKFNERTESSRFNRYEERLEPLDKKKKKKRRKKKSKTKKSSTAENLIENDDYEDEGDYAAPIETISISSQQSIPNVSSGTSTRRPVPLTKPEKDQKTIPKPMKKFVENSDIYRSIKEAQKKRIAVSKSPERVEEVEIISEPKDTALDITSLEDLPDTISSSQMELVTKKILAQAGRLSQIEAREAFVTYLRRLQLRFLNAENTNIKDHNITQMDLVCRFLRKASSNLQNPMEIKIPTAESGIPVIQRKRILGDLLVEFIARYQGDTDMMLNDDPVFSDVVERPLFQKFCMSCKESEVEEILTKYTTENKSASVFLGAKKRPKEKKHQENKHPDAHDPVQPEKQEHSGSTSPVKSEKVESVESITVQEKPTRQPSALESPYSVIQQHGARGRPNFSTGREKSRVRSASQEPKLLKRDNREANQIPSTSNQAPPYPSSCRDAAFIYSGGNAQKQIRPSIVPRADFTTAALAPRVNTASHFSSATSSDAIKLALKGLDRHNTQAEHKTVTELAKQLARVKLNQNVKKRPNSATTVQHQRHQRYSNNRPNSTTDRSNNTASDLFSIPSRTKPRPYSATSFIPQDALIPKPPPKPCWR